MGRVERRPATEGRQRRWRRWAGWRERPDAAGAGGGVGKRPRVAVVGRRAERGVVQQRWAGRQFGEWVGEKVGERGMKGGGSGRGQVGKRGRVRRGQEGEPTGKRQQAAVVR